MRGENSNSALSSSKSHTNSFHCRQEHKTKAHFGSLYNKSFQTNSFGSSKIYVQKLKASVPSLKQRRLEHGYSVCSSCFKLSSMRLPPGGGVDFTYLKLIAWVRQRTALRSASDQSWRQRVRRNHKCARRYKITLLRKTRYSNY